MPARKTPARPAAATAAPYEVRGSLWIAVDGRPLGGHGRIALLRAVQQHGSITQAARAFGMSYKGAWMAIEAMAEASGAPLVERATGGRGGGSTRLTPQGERLVERFEQVDAAHRRFVAQLAERTMDLSRDFSLLQVMNVKTSARNQWLGQVQAVRPGTVNDEIELTLPGGARLRAIVTRESSAALDLRPGRAVLALAKASAVLLAVGEARIGAGNRFPGRVLALRPGAVNAEVSVETDEGLQIVAIVDAATLAEMDLQVGTGVCALIRPSDLILATVD